MEKIQFTDPETGEVAEFAVEEETTLNGTRYLLVSEGCESGDCEAYILKEISTQGKKYFTRWWMMMWNSLRWLRYFQN